jgi:hypothetical protein
MMLTCGQTTYTPENRSAVMAFRVRAASRGGHEQFEYRMIVAGGRIVWLREVGSREDH